MGKAKPKSDNRADTRGGGWVGLPHVVVDSAAYRHLSLWARALLVEIVREFNGYNNGEIGLPQRAMADRLGTTNYRKISSAIAELMEHGLIDVAADAQWKERRSREYRLTFVTTGDRNHLRQATNEYRNWSPSQKIVGDAVSADGNHSADEASARARKLDDAASARIAQNRLKCAVRPNLAADASSHLICKPYPSPEMGGADQHETPEIDPLNAGGPKLASDASPQLRAFADRMVGRA